MGGESRHFRLPRMNSFPKLDGRQVRQAAGAARAATRGGVIIEGQAGSLPEMAADVIDPGVGYATQNVKRDRSAVRPWWGAGLGQVVGRMLGSHRAARP